MSDDGSDDNDCHSASAPCRKLQTVLDRATDGADIYVTSNTLSLDFRIVHISGLYILGDCIIKSSLSYTLRSLYNSTIKLTCSHMYVYLLVLVSVLADSAAPLHYSFHQFHGSILDTL